MSLIYNYKAQNLWTINLAKLNLKEFKILTSSMIGLRITRSKRESTITNQTIFSSKKKKRRPLGRSQTALNNSRKLKDKKNWTESKEKLSCEQGLIQIWTQAKRISAKSTINLSCQIFCTLILQIRAWNAWERFFWKTQEMWTATTGKNIWNCKWRRTSKTSKPVF